MNRAPLPWGEYFFPSLNVRRGEHSRLNRTWLFYFWSHEAFAKYYAECSNIQQFFLNYLHLKSHTFHPYSFNGIQLCLLSLMCLSAALQTWWLVSFRSLQCARSLAISVMLWLMMWRVRMLLHSVYSSHASRVVMQQLWRKSQKIMTLKCWFV